MTKDDFIEASEKLGFNIANDLGTDAIETEMWYDSITAA